MVRARLGQPGAWISIRPQTIKALDQTTLICKVQVRSQTPVQPMALAAALVEAVSQNAGRDHARDGGNGHDGDGRDGNDHDGAGRDGNGHAAEVRSGPETGAP
jgi:hypothetical protein